MDDDLKARLLKPRVPEAEVELPGFGTVRVRGLSRGEALALNKGKELGIIKDTATWERKIVALAMVEPTFTEDEVEQWQNASTAGGELDAVTDKITELSGLSEDADKSGVPGDGNDGPGVRALPRGEAVDDGGAAPGGDE